MNILFLMILSLLERLFLVFFPVAIGFVKAKARKRSELEEETRAQLEREENLQKLLRLQRSCESAGSRSFPVSVHQDLQSLRRTQEDLKQELLVFA